MSRRVKRHFGKESWDEYYRRYQSILADEYLIPALTGWGVVLEGKRLLEVGGGDGGCGAAFGRAGCEVISMDIDERLVGIAREFNRQDGLEIQVFHGDVCDERSEALRKGPFDIILLRDVIEHISEPAVVLRNLKGILSDEGTLFVVFPPYYSPYGAHQQVLSPKKLAFLPYNKLPYIQMLPNWLFLSLVKGETPAHREVARLHSIRLTLRKFAKAYETAGFRIRGKKLFLSRPTYALRYGVPVMNASILGMIPLLRELVVTGAYYLLERAP